MILELEFIDSPDTEILGDFQIHRPIITMGSSPNCTVVINDEEMAPAHLLLKITKDGIVCHNSKGQYYHSNEKKIDGVKKHTIGDKILIGKTLFSIKSFVYSPELDSKENIKKQYLKLVEAKSPFINILQHIENELVFLEKTTHATTK